MYFTHVPAVNEREGRADVRAHSEFRVLHTANFAARTEKDTVRTNTCTPAGDSHMVR
jgi:hypothetical protein